MIIIPPDMLNEGKQKTGVNILAIILFTFFCFYFIPKGFSQKQEFTKNFSDTLNKSRLNSVIITTSSIYAAGLTYLNFIWYHDHDRVPFHFYNDMEGWLQMDKAGHAYGAYYESYQGYYGLRWAGVDKKKALLYGAPLGIIFQTPIEIFDGIYEGYGFSWWDTWANIAGTALFTTQQAIWDQQYIMVKFSFSPSKYSDYHYRLGKTYMGKLFKDYNGHTYWLSGNLNEFTGTSYFPSWLNVAVGYSANGMIGEFGNPDYYQGETFPEFQRYRQVLFSIDIDLSKIPTEKRWLRSLLKHLNFIKFPFPAIEYNEIEGITFRPVYF